VLLRGLLCGRRLGPRWCRWPARSGARNLLGQSQRQASQIRPVGGKARSRSAPHGCRARRPAAALDSTQAPRALQVVRSKQLDEFAPAARGLVADATALAAARIPPE